MDNLPQNFKRTILAKDNESGFFIELQEIAPNSIFSKHCHKSEEWVYVVAGQFKDEFRKYPTGTFTINAKDSVHTPHSEQGCKLIVVRKADYQSMGNA